MTSGRKVPKSATAPDISPSHPAAFFAVVWIMGLPQVPEWGRNSDGNFAAYRRKTQSAATIPGRQAGRPGICCGDADAEEGRRPRGS